MRHTDLTGRHFGRLTALEPAPNRGKKTRWTCQCECGQSVIVASTHLVSGHTESCGCLQRERSKIAATRHGGRRTRLYTIWEHMRQRCSNPGNKDFSYYGGRGIHITPDWNDFDKFQEWALSSGYSAELTLDRIDPNGNYQPDNCRWATRETQSQNRRCCKKEVVL